MKYELTKELETGNATVDAEHRELFRAINNLFDACGSGKGRQAIDPTVKFLLEYVDRHFKHEEQLQVSSGYPGMAAHKTFHQGYAKKLREIALQLPDNPSVADLVTLNSHISVLISHIRTEDKKLGAHLKAH